jgi:hypothetical protein
MFSSANTSRATFPPPRWRATNQTLDQVRTAWGHPRRHQTAHYESGDDDTFYYGSLFSSGGTYLVTFKNGFCDAWTEGN